MPLSISSSNSFKTTLWMFLGLVLIAGTIKMTLLYQIPQERRGIPNGYFAAKAQHSGRFDAVIAGDSRIYRGVSPEAMSTVLEDKTILNFGFSAAGHSPTFLKAAEAKLDRNGSKILVLGITPYSLTEVASVNKHYMENLSTTRLKKLTRPMERVWSPEETKRVYQYLAGTLDNYRQTPHADGWIESTRVPPDPTIALKTYRNLFRTRQASQRVQDELFEYIRDAKLRGVRVFAFRPPTTPAMESLENKHSGFDEQEFIPRFIEAGGNWITHEDRFCYTTHDGAHLTATSAVVFSKYLARSISQQLDSVGDGNKPL